MKITTSRGTGYTGALRWVARGTNYMALVGYKHCLVTLPTIRFSTWDSDEKFEDFIEKELFLPSTDFLENKKMKKQILINI